jgi:HK97 family phage portal protein
VSLLSQLLPGSERRSLENPNVAISANELASLLDMTVRTASGVVVNQESATRQISVTACQRIIAETISALPLGLYVKHGKTVERLPLPRWADLANPDLEGPDLVEDFIYSLLSDGNAFTQIVRDRRDDVVELYPLIPNQTQVDRLSTREPVKYTWFDLDGRSHVDYGPSGRDILHIRAFRRPGTLRGLSPIERHRQAIGTGLATEEFGATFFGNGAQAGGHIEHPGKMSRQAAQVLVETWMRDHGGLRRAHKPGVLTEGMTWKQTQIPPEHAQFLDTQKFTVAQIARMYRVPPHLIGDVERSTSWGTGIEEQNIAFLKFTLLCWIIRVERALTTLVRPTRDPDGPYFKFTVDSILRGSLKERYEAYAIARQWGWESANSVRHLEEAEPIEGGDTYLAPLNMMDAADISVRPLRDRAQAAYYLGQLHNMPAEVAAQLANFELTDEQLTAIDESDAEAAAQADKAKGIPTDGTEPIDPTAHPDDTAAAGDGVQDTDTPPADGGTDDKPGGKS